jgi:hypothetical protein
MIVGMWLNGRNVGASPPGGLARRGLGGLAALWLLAGCGNGQSPTEAARLAESRRLEAEQLTTPDAVDGLYQGSGPLIPRNGPPECPLQGFWSGYPRGTEVLMRVSSRVPGSVQAALASAVGPIAQATGGALSVNIRVIPEIDPQPGVNEVTVTEVALPRAAGCPSDAGCVQYRFAGRGLLMGARVVEPPGSSVGVHVHDAVGHAVLGLCHIDARLIGGPENSLMSVGPGVPPGSGAQSLTGLDLDAIRSVYASGLSPGAPRSAFLAARLVNLHAGQLPRNR